MENIKKFLIENYEIKGSYYCAEHLKVDRKKLVSIANQLKLKLSKEAKLESQKIGWVNRERDFRVDPKKFLKITTPEIAYILGLLWADGYIRKDVIAIECKKEDLVTLEWIFDKIGKWNKYYRNREGRKPQMTITTNNKPVRLFLEENDYLAKSILSADKILSKIPKNLQHYWFRGLFDGDGCFYCAKDLSSPCISIASSFEQDWSFLEKKLNEQNIKYKINRRVLNKTKNYKGSVITIRNIKDINKFCSYIYDGYDKYSMGLKRKHDKYIEFLKFREGSSFLS